MGDCNEVTGVCESMKIILLLQGSYFVGDNGADVVCKWCMELLADKCPTVM